MEQLNTVKSSIADAAMTRLCRTWFDEVWFVWLIVSHGNWGEQTKTGIQIPLKLTLHVISMWSDASTALPGRLMFVPHTGSDSENHKRFVNNNIACHNRLYCVIGCKLFNKVKKYFCNDFLMSNDSADSRPSSGDFELFGWNKRNSHVTLSQTPFQRCLLHNSIRVLENCD